MRRAEKATGGEDATSGAGWSVKAVLAAVGVVAATTVVTMLVLVAFGGTERLRGAVEQAGPWAPLVYVLLKAATFVAAPMSGTSRT